MKYGDMQNLLSVIIGLNLGFYAFRQIRMPMLTGIASSADALKTKLVSTQQTAQPCSAALRNSLQEFSDRVKLIDSWAQDMVRDIGGEDLVFGPVCVLVAVFATIMLIVSTVKFNDPIASRTFWTITIVGFVPVLTLIILNYGIARFWKNNPGKDLKKLWRDYFDLQTKVYDELDAMRQRGKP
jgi:hypothetical protein